jgi:uncharacterized protein (TIGR01777 family)
MGLNILLTGATGLVGSRLGIELARAGHEIIALTRSGRADDLPFPARCLRWDHVSDISERDVTPASKPIDAVIHLAGEPVSQRWTSAVKDRIEKSRVDSTRALVRSAGKFSKAPSVWLNASAIGFYGHRGDEVLSEKSSGGRGFLPDVCARWENALRELPAGTRECRLRFGVILAPDGGALPKMLLPFRYGVGGRIGDGRARMSWIHIDDAVRAIMFALESSSLNGPVNVTAPGTVTNLEFTKAMARAVGMPAIFPVPVVALKGILGEMSRIVTESIDARPERLAQSGFEFRFPDVDSALRDCAPRPDQKGQRLLIARHWLPEPPEALFPFFSRAENLERITPPWLNFRVTKKSSDVMGDGLLIDYRLSIRGLPMIWRTRIESWDPPRQFVDTQLIGPYHTWHHTHRFERLGEGTLMTDVVRYKMWVWPFGDIALPLVAHDVRSIFGWRRKVLGEMWPRSPDQK